MHGKSLVCSKCEYESPNLHSLSTHIIEEHRQTRTFYSKLKENIPPPTPTSETASTTSSENKCPGSCSSLKKTFDHEDELKLHMMFYHGQKQQ